MAPDSNDKSQPFDKYRKQIIDLHQKASELEYKFKSQQDQLKTRDSNKLFKTKKFRYLEDARGSYDFIEDDPTIPAGWKSCYKQYPDLSMSVRQAKKYWAPDGKYCSSRRNALQYMVNVLKSSEKDIRHMKRGLETDGWIVDKHLEGWYYMDLKSISREKEFQKRQFINPAFNLILSLKKAIEYLLVKGSDSDIRSFLLSHVRQEARNMHIFQNKQIPFPWRVVHFDNKDFNFIAPDGTIFSQVKTLLRYNLFQSKLSIGQKDSFKTFLRNKRILRRGAILLKNKPSKPFIDSTGKVHQSARLALAEFSKSSSTTTADLEKVRKVLREKHQWISLPYLPKNWMSKEKNMKFLTETGEVIITPKKAVEYMKEKDYSQDDITIFVKYILHGDFQEGTNLPPGWKKGGESGKRLLDPKGKFFQSRSIALRFMLKNNYNKGDIETMRNGLSEEGWEFSDDLPKHWMLKPRTKGKLSFINLANFNVIWSKRELMIELREEGQCEEMIRRFSNESQSNLPTILSKEINSRRQWKTDPSEPPDWKVDIEERGPRRNIQKLFLSPSGYEFRNRIHVLKDMVENKSFYTTREITWMKENLLRDGWSTSFNLPDGWYFKYQSSNWTFLNHTFEKFKCISEASNHMAKNGYSEEDIKKLKEIKDYHDWRAEPKNDDSTWKEHPSLPATLSSWNSSPYINLENEKTELILPLRWKIRFSLDGKTIIINEDNKEFHNRQTAISFMIQENYPPSDIFKLWNTLHLEGWLDDPDNLPTGWKKKSSDDGDHFLSPLMEEITSKQALRRLFIENELDYSDEDFNKVIKFTE